MKRIIQIIKRTFYWKRLRIQIIGFCLIALILALGGFTALTVTQQEKRLFELASNEANALARNSAAGVVEWVLREDIDKLSEAALRAAEFAEVNSIKILDASGLPLAIVEKNDAGVPEERFEFDAIPLPESKEGFQSNEGDRIISWALIENDNVLGWVRLDYSLNEIIKLRTQLWQRAIVFLCIFLIGSILFFWRFMDRPLRAIEQITEFSSKMVDMKGETVPVDNRTHETGKLANTLNMTSKQLRDNWLSLQAARDDLELRVERRTKDLANTVDRLEYEMAERKKVEAQLLHVQKMESVGQLAAGIAHEINTPAQYIGNNLAFISDELGNLLEFTEDCHKLCDTSEKGMIQSEKIKSLLEELDAEYLVEELPSATQQSIDGVNQISNIVRSVKEFSHPGGKDKSLYDVNENLLNAINVSTSEWKFCAELETNFAKDLPKISAIGGELNQVFLNLIVNAAHAMEAKHEGSDDLGKIIVATADIGDFVEVTVSDDGTGIPESIISKIYDPFFTTKEVGKGTGQGLHMAWQIVVEQHGGKLSVDSQEGIGTRFCVSLPKN